ncbi:MAG: SRPBCC family protein [Marinomonas sp.]
MKITKKIVINQPADLVWNFIAYDFDQAHLWMGPIPHSYAIGTGNGKQGAPMEGRICHLSDKAVGAKAKEVITAFDEANKSLTFEVTSTNVPAIIPIKKNVVSMKVKSLGRNQSQVIWVSRPQIKAFVYPYTLY